MGEGTGGSLRVASHHEGSSGDSIEPAITAVPFGWILCALWVPLNPLRPSFYQDNFYDLQTRSVLDGHLSLANGALGLEGFAHAGRTDTYFGLFPSIIRHPNCW